MTPGEISFIKILLIENKIKVIKEPNELRGYECNTLIFDE